MNMTMIDVTDVAAENDDEVVLIGRQGNQGIRAEELAEKSGTIAYELLSRVARRTGDESTAAVADRILAEERRAAERIADTWDSVVDASLAARARAGG